MCPAKGMSGMTLEFTKMQGCGNDYIYVDCMNGSLENAPELARRLSPRHFAVGADGLICICKSGVADAQMRMYNADGSESAMCGNGIRCVAQWLFDHGYVGEMASVETLAGIKTMRRMDENCWQVDMGVAEFAPVRIPAVGLGETPIIGGELMVNGRAWPVTCVSMGNPHCVSIVPDTAAVDLPVLGPAFEHHAAFPQGINAEFVQVLNHHHIKMRVWERGTGETMACGTGACASAAACVALGLCRPEANIRVDLAGGWLTVFVQKDWRVLMTGPAVTAFTGAVQL